MGWLDVLILAALARSRVFRRARRAPRQDGLLRLMRTVLPQLFTAPPLSTK